ncbi:MAG: alpha/beta hydrolase [Armatimonadota bacterium]|jgi:enterochelin esterase-like enzyme
MFTVLIRCLPSVICLSLFCGAGFAQAQVRQQQRLGGEPRWVTDAIAAPGVQHRTFESESAGCAVSYHVFLPDEYDAEPERRFPVLYWLHGSLGGLPGIVPLSTHFGSAMRAGHIPPMVVVFANGLRLSLWVDSKDRAMPLETIVVEELVPHIDATFRTIASREGRIVEGFSMGGYGAARLGLKHPEMFGAASSLSGGPLQREFTHSPRTSDAGRAQVLRTVFGSDHGYFRALSPWVLAEQNADAVRAGPLLRVVIGEEDEMLAVTREFVEHLTELEIPHAFTLLPGVGHDTRDVLQALGEDGWAFYREALADIDDPDPTPAD